MYTIDFHFNPRRSFDRNATVAPILRECDLHGIGSSPVGRDLQQDMKNKCLKKLDS